MTDSKKGIAAVVAMLSTILTDKEWAELVNLIRIYDQERKNTD